MTSYLAEFKLTALVRRVIDSQGNQGWEPLWLGCPDSGRGLAVFVSALDAEIYRQGAINAGSDGWMRVPLSHFGLAEHVHQNGGHLICQMVFGFVASLQGEMVTFNDLPRLCMVPVGFDLQGSNDSAVTFSFNPLVFDFMREQWLRLDEGSDADHAASMNDATDAELNHLAARALCAIQTAEVCHQRPQANDWCIYAPGKSRWYFGPEELRNKASLH